jgi:uncharacterized LabA/DUF88 family protein
MSDVNRRLWLIDAGYLNKAFRSFDYQNQIDWVKLRNKLEEKEPIWRVYYFDSGDGAQKGFYNWLSQAPPNGPKMITKIYELKNYHFYGATCERCDQKIVCPTDSSHRLFVKQQKGVDVGIATIAIKHLNNYDTLILSSGDGDFFEMIECVSEANKRIELVVFANSVAPELQSRADNILLINDFADEVKKSYCKHEF